MRYAVSLTAEVEAIVARNKQRLLSACQIAAQPPFAYVGKHWAEAVCGELLIFKQNQQFATDTIVVHRDLMRRTPPLANEQGSGSFSFAIRRPGSAPPHVRACSKWTFRRPAETTGANGSPNERFFGTFFYTPNLKHFIHCIGASRFKSRSWRVGANNLSVWGEVRECLLYLPSLVI